MRQSSLIKAFFTRFVLAIGLSYLLYLSFDQVLRPDEVSGTFRALRKFLLSSLWLGLFFTAIGPLKFWIRFGLVSILLLPSAILMYLALVYQLPFSVGIISDIIDSKISVDEFSGFLSVEAILTFILIMLSFVVIAWFIGVHTKGHPLKNKNVFVIFVGVTLLSVFYKKGDEFWPLRKIIRPLKAIHRYYTVDQPLMKRLSLLEHQKPKIVEATPIASDTCVIFHIGESVRSDHTSLFGYYRNTTPNLLAEHHKNRLFTFPKAISYSIFTRLSVVGILTPTSIGDPIVRGQSFLPALNSNGISTYGVFSNMSSFADDSDAALISLTQMCQKKNFSMKYGPEMLSQIKKILKPENNPNPKFMIYYGEGSHSPYTKYDKSNFLIYKPISTHLTRDQRSINNYDNTIHALDYFIKEILEEIKEQNAVYIYASDHGETLGEDDLWVRRDDRMVKEEVRDILFFVWFSEKFKEQNSQKFLTFLDNTKKIQVVSHDNIYHSILNLFGIKTSFYNSKMDLFSVDAVGFQGKMPSKLPLGSPINEIRFEN